MKRNSLLLILVFILSSALTPSAFAQKESETKTESQTGIKWMTFEDAVKRNKKKPRKIFIDVYTDWCGWCKKMDAETFKDPALVEYINEHYYAVKFNAEQKEPVTFKKQVFVNTNPEKKKSPHQLAVALLKQELRYPSYVILDGKSEWIDKIKGYKTAEDFLPLLKFYGDDQYKVMTWSEYNDLKKL